MLQKISLPIEQTYYRSPRQSHRLMCWLPTDELKAMVRRKEAHKDVLMDFPAGLETVVDDDALATYEIKLGLDADTLNRGFRFFEERGAVGPSGRVRAKDLHKRIADASSAHPKLTLEKALERAGVASGPLEEPRMSKGSDDPRLMMQSF